MYIISYDISSDRRRNKIFKLLNDYGTARQYSLFECDITPKRYRELYKKLAALMQGEEQGNIRIYNLCKSCSQNVTVIGIDDSDKKDTDEGMIFI